MRQQFVHQALTGGLGMTVSTVSCGGYNVAQNSGLFVWGVDMGSDHTNKSVIHKASKVNAALKLVWFKKVARVIGVNCKDRIQRIIRG